MTPADSDFTGSPQTSQGSGNDQGGGHQNRRRNNNNRRRRNNNRNRNNYQDSGGDQPEGQPRGRVRGYGRREGQHRERKPVELTGDAFAVEGIFEIAPKGFGFLRRPDRNFEQSQEDVFISPETTRENGLRPGVWIKGEAKMGHRGPQLVEIKSINDIPAAEAKRLPFFDELKAINPDKAIRLESTPERYTTRTVDIMAPIGRGQRGLIVSPPRSGKTTMLLHMAEAVQDMHEETLHLIILLVDERPEEVTEFKRQLPNAEIYASSNDESPRNHCRLAELCIERAKRLVEAGKHVFILMDSITRLARAYNNGMSGGGGRGKKHNNRGRGYQSGGIVAGALEMPRRLFAAARNTREAGSLTIVATALIQTNSKADEAIFQEFKGTGNMELVLDRKIAEHYVYPAVDIFKSGTRREELLIPEINLHKLSMIRRGLSGHKPIEAMERLLFFMKKFPNNAQMMLEIKG